MGDLPADRACQHCGAIITWRDYGAGEGQWRHVKSGRGDVFDRLYITTHAPEPRPQYEPST